MEPAVAVKVGTMIATGGVIADAVIFSDGSYMYLAAVGALVSVFGVAHEVFGANHREYGIGEIIVELMKGIALGLLAIPFWFLLITSVGDDLLLKYFQATPEPSTFTSLGLIIAFGLSWYTVPIFDFIAKELPKKILNLFSRGK